MGWWAGEKWILRREQSFVHLGKLCTRCPARRAGWYDPLSSVAECSFQNLDIDSTHGSHDLFLSGYLLQALPSSETRIPSLKMWQPSFRRRERRVFSSSALPLTIAEILDVEYSCQNPISLDANLRIVWLGVNCFGTNIKTSQRHCLSCRYVLKLFLYP